VAPTTFSCGALPRRRAVRPKFGWKIYILQNNKIEKKNDRVPKN
jgi:hypothetical protein